MNQAPQNEDPEIKFVEDIALGFEPLLDDSDREAIIGEYWKHKTNGDSVVLCDNKDGTLTLWALRRTFWV